MMFKLDSFQEEAINYARNNHSVIVSAPTGAGKTLIAEYIIEDCVARHKGVIYTAPIKALSNQKFRDFSKKYPEKTGIVTGDVNINRNSPVLIMTTEIFRNAILVNPQEFEHREWVIFDEIHYLADIERGTVWEEAILLLPNHMKMLALSATIPNINEFVDWLKKIHKFPVKVVLETKRPVPLHFFFQSNNMFFPDIKSLKKAGFVNRELRGNFNDPKERENEKPIFKPNRLDSLIEYLNNINAYPCLYFSFSRRRCEDLAEELSSHNFLHFGDRKKILQLFDNLVAKFNVSSSPHISLLSPLIKRGIAYHHAGLLPTIKEIIERIFNTGLIKFIFTTETFALGINMPARTVIFDNLSKFYGRNVRYLKTRDFYQMAGRSGRRGIDNEGFVFSRINLHHIDISSLEDIIFGKYELIESQLNSCYATILNLYKIMGEKIYDIYPRSFHFHQYPVWKRKDMVNLLKRKLGLLRELGYIVNDSISLKAELAANVYSFELPIGELNAYGFFENISEENLFIVITALVYEPRRGEMKPALNKNIRKLKRELDIFINDIHKIEKSFRIYPLSKNFCFHLSDASKLWFQGSEFYFLNKSSNIDEGEIVRYFRMSIQVLKEMSTSPIITDTLKVKINNCLKRVNRDIIDAEKELRQEL